MKYVYLTRTAETAIYVEPADIIYRHIFKGILGSKCMICRFTSYSNVKIEGQNIIFNLNAKYNL